MNRTKRILSWALVAGLAAAAACVHDVPSVAADAATAAGKPAPLTTAAEPAAEVSRALLQPADIAERVVKSVVNISVKKRVARVRSSFPGADQRFRELFPFGGPEGPFGPDPSVPQQGQGSGVIVSADGLVITNHHVIEGASDLEVKLNDGKRYRAKVVGSDAPADVAVVRLEGAPSGLVPLPFGDSSKVRLAETVLAIGNPFGVGQTVTMGIVSATGRSNVGIEDYEEFIQTDAAINPGNSGGALVNLRGELIGMNTAILSRSGGSAGIGFAIPSNMVKVIMDSLTKHGKVVRGWLGVSIQELTPELASAMELGDRRGVLIGDVTDDGPGKKAGLESGDVVLSLNGEPMDNMAKFRNRIASMGPGASAELELLRNGKPRTLSVSLGELPSRYARGARGGPEAPEAKEQAFGLSLAPLDETTRGKLRLNPRVKGAVIAEVQPGSPAEETGLQPGDVIVEVNRRAVEDPEAAQAAIRRAGAQVLLRVLRGGMSLFFVMQRG